MRSPLSLRIQTGTPAASLLALAAALLALPACVPASDAGRYSDRAAYVAPDGRLFFSSDRPVSAGDEAGTWRVWVVAPANGSWGEPTPLPAPVNEAGDYHPAVAADGTVYRASANRPDGLGRSDIYAATPEGDGYAQPVHPGPRKEERTVPSLRSNRRRASRTSTSTRSSAS